jgi:hypothetical protein
MYNPRVIGRRALPLFAVLALAGCGAREVEKDLRVTGVRTGWYDAGIVEGDKNKLVPSITFKLENVSDEGISRVQVNAVFRRVGEHESWGEHFVNAIDRHGLPAGATGGPIVLRSTLGYTGTEPRLQMLQNREFVDAKVEIYGKHGSRTWVKLAEYQIDRQLLTE